MLGRNAARLGGNAQPRGGGSYGGRGGQITWRTEGGYRERGGNMGGVQVGPRRDPNAMDVDRGRGEIGRATIAGSLATWSGIIGREIKRE